MKKVMVEKMRLLRMEQEATAHLVYQSAVHSETLAEMEEMAESKAHLIRAPFGLLARSKASGGA